MRFKGLSKGFFILILFIVTVAFLDILGSYYSSVLWFAILAVIFHPMKNRLRKLFSDKNGLAAFVTVVAICLIVITPLAIVFSSMAVEFNAVYDHLQHNNTQLPCPSGRDIHWLNIIWIRQPAFSKSCLRLRYRAGNIWRAACL